MDIDPLAAKLAEANRIVVEQRAALAVAKAHRTKLKIKLIAAIRKAIVDDPTATNVALASRFGMRSETSIRNLRATMQAGKTDE